MAERIATRVAYGNALADLGDRYNFYVMDADLSGSTQTAVFGKKFPHRFINCGIAEQNMVASAAGIAATGVPVFVSSFAMFAAGRAYEQIRNAVAHSRLNVKICASHAGVTVGEDGATHQFCEDLAIMRSIPGMTVLCPADATETYAAMEAVLTSEGPVYCRLGRYAVPVIFDPATYRFNMHRAEVLADGRDATVFATGIMNAAALDARALLAAEGIDLAVVNVHTIKPLDRETVLHYAAKTKRVVTAEEHTVVGGLGGAIAELLCEELPTKMARVGLEDIFGTSASAAELLDYYRLNAEGIAAKVRKLVL